MCGQTGVQMFKHNYAKGLSRQRVRWTCIHIPIHVDILTKLWDQRRGDREMDIGAHMFVLIVQRRWNRGGESGEDV